MQTEDRVDKIADYLEKPYKKLIKYYMKKNTLEEIDDAMLEVGLTFPEEVYQKLPAITDAMLRLTIGNKLWNETTGNVVTVVSVILDEELPGFQQLDEDLTAFVLSALIDMHTLVFAQMALQSPDLKEMIGI